MKLAESMRKLWDNVNPRTAHFGDSGERDEMFSIYAEKIISRVDVNDKTIIDYGCGGGLLGVYLLSNFGIKKYIAYDLSERSLSKARKNIGENIKAEFNLVPIPHTWNFKEKNPDIFICLACVIHFPTKIYLDNFLQTVNNCGAQTIIIEIRNDGKGTHFQEKPYHNSHSIIRACHTDYKYVKNILLNYELQHKTEINKSCCETLTFEKKYDTIKI